MITPLGWLERVPTYKDQQEKLADTDLSTYGFLGYPLLQAADILIYRAKLRAGGRGPGAAHRVHARGRAALQPPLRPRAGLRGEGQGRGEEDGHARRRACSTSCAPSSWSRARPRRSRAAQALLDEQQNLSRGDRERLYGWLEGGGKMILVEPEALLTEASQACRASTARRCRSPTATPSRCARSRSR